MNNVKMKVLVMFANDYSMKGEDGRLIEGCTINYYPWGENGEVLESTFNIGYGSPAGIQRGKGSLPREQRLNIQAVPGIYEAEFEMTVGSDGKFVSKPVALTNFLGKVKMENLLEKAGK